MNNEIKTFLENLYGGVSDNMKYSLYPDFIKGEGNNNYWKKSLVSLSKDELFSQVGEMIERQRGLEGSAFYYGVIPSSVSPDRTGRVTTDLIMKYGEIPCLFCDIDFKDWNDEDKIKSNEGKGESYSYESERDYRDKVFGRFNKGLPPSIVIFTGGGYHCYWVLEKPLITEEDKKRWYEVEKKLVEYLDSDKGVRDFSRVLRMPLSYNHKRGKQSKIKSINNNRYSLGEVESFLSNQEGESFIDTLVDREMIKRDIRGEGNNNHKDIDIINSIPLIEIGGHFGDNLKEGSIPCPFHDDKTPSSKLYRDTNKIFCWTCNKSWDSFEYVKDKLGTQDYKEVFSFFRDNYPNLLGDDKGGKVMRDDEKGQVGTYKGEGDIASQTIVESFFYGNEHIKTWTDEIERNMREKNLSINKTIKIPSRISPLDNLLSGGFRPGLYGIAGFPGVGKTSFMLSVARKLSKNMKVVFFSLEMRSIDLLKWSLSWDTPIERGVLVDEELSLDDLDIIRETVKDNPVYSNLIIIDNKRKMREIVKSCQEIKPDLIFIDYLQRIKPDSLSGELRERVSNVSYELVELTKTLGVPIITISSVPRETYKFLSGNETIDKLSLFKESGDIEFSITGGITLTRPPKDILSVMSREENSNIFEMTVVKNRYGNIYDSEGKYITKYISFNFRTGNLEEMEKPISYKPDGKEKKTGKDKGRIKSLDDLDFENTEVGG